MKIGRAGRKWGADVSYANDHYYWAQPVGRLRPGVSREQAQAPLAAVFQQGSAGSGYQHKRRDSGDVGSDNRVKERPWKVAINGEGQTLPYGRVSDVGAVVELPNLI